MSVSVYYIKTSTLKVRKLVLSGPDSRRLEPHEKCTWYDGGDHSEIEQILLKTGVQDLTRLSLGVGV